MSIKITATSTCDLPAELLERYQITMVPLYVSFGGKTYRDGVDVGPEDIFRHVEEGGQLPTTSAVNIADYQELFAQLSPQYDEVLHITIGSEFSCCYQNALVAAEDYPNVHVVDSRNLTVGQGILAVAAAEAAQRGADIGEIKAMLEEMTARVDTTFVVDKLDYLAKGGRCSSVVALGANLLKLKPCIVLSDGRMNVGKKYRGAFDKVLSDYVLDQLAGKDVDQDRVFVVHTRCDPSIPENVCDMVRQFGFREVITAVAGCTISCHCGPNTLGIIFLRK
ncbi:MAG: DegV family protein [Oscillospiraceae bacterium]|nr:DegV family protein [Oscillospiraceae bacterium]